jgi:hypothetical protein
VNMLIALKIPACRGAPAHSHPDMPSAQAFMVVPVCKSRPVRWRPAPLRVP